jgi:hypothetical protein
VASAPNQEIPPRQAYIKKKTKLNKFSKNEKQKLKYSKRLT